MRKRNWRRGICAGLILAMTVGLCACGKGDGSSSSGDGKGENSAESVLAKQYVYSYEEVELPNTGDDMSIRNLVQCDGRVYLIAEIYNWNEGGSGSEVKLFSMKTDGTDVQEIELQKPAGAEDDSTKETEDVTDAAGETSEGDSGLSSAMPLTEEVTASDYTNYANFALTNNGKLYAIKNHTVEDYSDPENYISKTELSVSAWDLTGALLWEAPLEDMQSEEESLWIRTMVPAEDGSVDLLIGGDVNVYKMSVDMEGNVGQRQELVNGKEIISKANDVIVNDKDASLLITYYNDEWTKMFLTTYDMKTDTVGEEIELPEIMMRAGYSTMNVGVTTDIVYSTNQGLFGYNKGAEAPEQIMSFVNSDLNTGTLNNVAFIDETHFIAFYYDNADNKQKVAVFTKRNPEDIPDKQVIKLAGTYLNYELKSRLIQYNKQSDKYRIVVEEYEVYNTMEDYTAGTTKLNNDIISGNMPDILVVTNNLPMESYISKGLIADVDKLIAEDEELSQKEFMENLFEAYRVDGKLYYIIPNFNVRTMMGKTSMLEGRTSWTMQEFQQFVDSLPEGTQAMGTMVRDYFMSLVLQYCGSDFVDVSTGKCNFDSEQFIAMLEYAKTLPTEMPENYYEGDYWMNSESQYRDNKTVLMETYISDFMDMVRNINGVFGDEVTYIGFPTESGMGSIIQANEMYALSAKSKNLEGAWDFIRFYLTDEFQESEQNWTLPVSKDVFMKKANEAMEKPYYMDENGKKVEYDMEYYINGESIILDPLTQEQVDQLVELISSINKKQYYNEDIYNIITEEAAAFFEGQKSAKDVAQIIQSRAQIFVDEHR